MPMSPPSGFAIHTRTSPATRGWEPLYAATDTGVFRLGIVIADAHCNSRGMLHGGVIATLADNACGLSLVLAGAGAGAVTTSA
jgi:acyl-coenzyme A thioesterase PaaI-like protein